LAHRQLAPAVSAHEVQPTVAGIDVSAFDDEPVQLARKRRHEGKQDTGWLDVVVAAKRELQHSARY
jgi:hypothetical protein